MLPVGFAFAVFAMVMVVQQFLRCLCEMNSNNVISAVYENPENKCCAQEQHSSNELSDVYENTENMCCAQKHNSPLNAVFE